MRNVSLHGQACASARGPVAACPGTAVPGGATSPLVWDSGVCAAVPPTALGAVMAAAHSATFMTNQGKARISAAGGGVSGSPPAWDPV